MTSDPLIPALRALQAAIRQAHLDEDFARSALGSTTSLEALVHAQTSSFEGPVRDRLREEFLRLGPLRQLVEDEGVTEILVNGPHSIWFEKHGHWFAHEDMFLSPLTYRNFFHRLCAEAHILTNIDVPKADGRWREFRVCVVQPPLVQAEFQMSLRRHNPRTWNFDTLAQDGWASPEDFAFLRRAIADKQNILIVGPTGSGKTSILNACLQQLPRLERVVILEDTDELKAPNGISTKLLARCDSQKLLSEVTLMDLVQLSLRLRPDRLVLGEVRGGEAKDLLMALATGHRGGLATLHADDAPQALLRLEMLIQLGAPQWSLQAVRQLIRLSLDLVVVVKLTAGRRVLESLSRISSLESFGFTLETIKPQDLKTYPVAPPQVAGWTHRSTPRS